MLRSPFAQIRESTLFKTAVGSGSLKVVSAAVGFLSGVVLARLLGLKEFGVYALAMAAINLAATVAALGLPSLVTREVSKYEAREQWGLLRGLVQTSHRWVAYGTVMVLGVTGGLVATGWVLPGLHWVMLLLAVLLTPLIALNQLRSAILRGLHWVILADVPELLLRPLLMLLFVVSAFLWLGHANATLAIGFQLVAVSCGFFLGTRFLHARIPQSVTEAESSVLVRAWARETRPFFWITLVSLVEGQIGIYILGYLTGPKQVGLFQVASQLVSPVIMGLMAVNMPLQPKLAAAWATGKKDEAQRLVTEAAKFSTAAAFTAATILIPFAEIVVRIYGEQYLPAANVLRILILGQLINAVSGPCGLVLAMTGHQKFVLHGLTAALIVNGLVNMALVPFFAAEGAAIAATAGLVVWNSLLVYWALRLADMTTPIFRITATKG